MPEPSLREARRWVLSAQADASWCMACRCKPSTAAAIAAAGRTHPPLGYRWSRSWKWPQDGGCSLHRPMPEGESWQA